MDNVVSFSKDIRPLFTEVDIAHMRRLNVYLDDYEYMSDRDHSAAVERQLSSKRMPPSTRGGAGPWPDEHIALFRAWIDGDYQP
ncbi:hypothetical protein [Actinopolymorpha alba]|uniref:hypothetical protein n=1 Tax=Actinopolymorpha alba TaxID=533267 RepID=UPI0012F6C2B5|nr:hypothetical protein [Actinopolymorpha alba]